MTQGPFESNDLYLRRSISLNYLLKDGSHRRWLGCKVMNMAYIMNYLPE